MEIENPFIFYAKNVEHKSFFDEKAGKKRYFVKGHIDSSDLDLVNDIVTREAMEDVSNQFKSRCIKLDFDHETLRPADGETEQESKLNLTRIPLGKSLNEMLDEKGNIVEFELNPNWKKFNSKGEVVMDFKELWDNVKSGFYDAFSIAYVPVKTALKESQGIKARLLNKLNIINVALTGNPINPGATMVEAMAKSLEWLKSKEDGIMEKEQLKEVTDALKSMKDEVKSLKEDVGNLKEKAKEQDNANSKGKKSKDPEKEVKSENSKDGKDEGAESKSFAEFKSAIKSELKSVKEMNDELKSGMEKVNEVLEKALPGSLGAHDKGKKSKEDHDKDKEFKSAGSNTLDLI